MIEQVSVKKSIPISVQILYALGIIGLIFGLVLSTVFFAFLGPILSVGLGAISILGFVLINKIHSGKRWALTIYTVLVSLNSIQTLAANPYTIQSYLVASLPITLLVVIWVKDKAYFS